MHMTSWITRAGIALLAAVAAIATVPGYTQTLRFGLAEDPDVLDPTLARTLSAAWCSPRFATNSSTSTKSSTSLRSCSQLNGRPTTRRLLKLRRGVTFHDGESSTPRR
jgi:peptide/nickel transport system substrate-binding protein